MHALAAGNGAGDTAGAVIAIAWITISTAAYFAPAIVALARHVPNTGSVIVIDVLLGWTIVGWIVALAMACRSKPPGYPAPRYPGPGRL